MAFGYPGMGMMGGPSPLQPPAPHFQQPQQPQVGLRQNPFQQPMTFHPATMRSFNMNNRMQPFGGGLVGGPWQFMNPYYSFNPQNMVGGPNYPTPYDQYGGGWGY